MENETLLTHLDETIKLPEDFDWKVYLIKNVDLILAGNNNEERAIDHYLNYGIKEYRTYYEKDKINFFIYCGGKCGSTTLQATFFKNYFKCIKLHTYNDYNSIYKESIYSLINDNKQKNETVYFIDSYRNPIDRKISSFFQNLDEYKYKLPVKELIEIFNNEFILTEYTLTINYDIHFKDRLTMVINAFINQQVQESTSNEFDSITDKNSITIDEITYSVIKLNLKTRDKLNILCNLIDKNKESLGIISYKKNFMNFNEYYHSIDELFRQYNISETFTDFDFDKKYGIHQHENMVFIKIRFCDIKNWGKILSDIFGKEMTIFSENLTETKKYSDLYKEFKSQYKVPKYFIKELLKDEHFNAYNTIEERRQYIKYWMDRSY